MSKVDMLSLPRPTRASAVKSYQEAGQQIQLSLRWPNASERALASEDAAELIRTYITGDEDRAAASFPDPDVIPSATLFNACALVARMQCPEDERERYEAVELAVLSARLPRTWMQVQRDVSEILTDGDRRQGE